MRATKLINYSNAFFSIGEFRSRLPNGPGLPCFIASLTEIIPTINVNIGTQIHIHALLPLAASYWSIQILPIIYVRDSTARDCTG